MSHKDSRNKCVWQGEKIYSPPHARTGVKNKKTFKGLITRHAHLMRDMHKPQTVCAAEVTQRNPHKS